MFQLVLRKGIPPDKWWLLAAAILVLLSAAAFFGGAPGWSVLLLLGSNFACMLAYSRLEREHAGLVNALKRAAPEAIRREV